MRNSDEVSEFQIRQRITMEFWRMLTINSLNLIPAAIIVLLLVELLSLKELVAARRDLT